MDIAIKDVISYQSKMLKYNKIPYILPMKTKNDEHLPQINHNYNNNQKLVNYLETNFLSESLILNIIDGFKELPGICEEYFLEEDHFNLTENTIYINEENKKIYFTYVPDKNIHYDVQKQMKQLNYYFMRKIKGEEEGAIEALHRLMILSTGTDFTSNSLRKLDEEEGFEIRFNNNCKEEGVQEKEIISSSEKKKINLYQMNLKALNKEAKLTFVILEAIVFFIIAIVLKQVMFTSLNPMILFLKSIFFIGVFGIVEGLIIKKIVWDELKGVESKPIDNEINVTKKNLAKEKPEQNKSIKKKVSNKLMTNKGENKKQIYIACLVNNKNEKIELTKTPFIIGSMKKEVDLVIPNKTVSKIHSRIISDGDQYYIEDLNSKNGTFINHDRVEGTMVLTDNCRITFSNENFIFREL